MSKKILYHILFWIFIFIWEFHFFMYMENFIPAVVDFVFVQTIFDASVVYINLFILIPKLLTKHGKATYIIGVFTSLLLMAFLVESFGLYGLLNDLGEEFNNGPNLSIYAKLFSYFIEFSLFMIISFLYWYFTKHIEEERKTLQFKNEKLQAELQLLRSQVSPYFLFDSLNHIYTLSTQNNPDASVMIEKLSDILRHIVYERKHKEVGLQEEMQMIENYIQLLRKMKSESAIRYHISGDFSNKKIAPLLLINIIENSFKHSNISSLKNSFLEIDISLKDKILTLKTKNTFAPNTEKKGTGLQSLKEQLQHIYPDKYTLKIVSKDSIFDLELTLELP